jgi:hypothetical protein
MCEFASKIFLRESVVHNIGPWLQPEISFSCYSRPDSSDELSFKKWVRKRKRQILFLWVFLEV